MKQTEYITRVLEPEKGKVLTQASEDTPDSDRVFSDKVFLAATDSPGNWREVTKAEAEAMKATNTEATI